MHVDASLAARIDGLASAHLRIPNDRDVARVTSGNIRFEHLLDVVPGYLKVQRSGFAIHINPRLKQLRATAVKP
ncbi:hypothetical protein D3C86_2117030 [compost metagenome]